MKITGLTRIRNEEIIIRDTLDHMGTFSDDIIVFDDASEDDTLKIIRNNANVSAILSNRNWSSDRPLAETENRRQLLEFAQKYSPDTDWFIYMDADERIEFDWQILNNLPKEITGIRMKLFDYYITKEDVDLYYTERRFIGPEYRNILMAFRNIPGLKYVKKDQRSPIVPGKIIISGYVKHYGKAVSVKQWEDTCDYYVQNFPAYAEKWKLRKGKAIHNLSDFGRPLITWEEKELKGIKLY
jgi:glycosyltransferase involved in cell wall biosynthesis